MHFSVVDIIPALEVKVLSDLFSRNHVEEKEELIVSNLAIFISIC